MHFEFVGCCFWLWYDRPLNGWWWWTIFGEVVCVCVWRSVIRRALVLLFHMGWYFLYICSHWLTACWWLGIANDSYQSKTMSSNNQPSKKSSTLVLDSHCHHHWLLSEWPFLNQRHCFMASWRSPRAPGACHLRCLRRLRLLPRGEARSSQPSSWPLRTHAPAESPGASSWCGPWWWLRLVHDA